MPSWIPTVELPATSRDGKGTKTVRYPLVGDELALLWMVNMGTIDMNVTLSRVDRYDRPDIVMFDLDPAPPAGIPRMRRGRAHAPRAARRRRARELPEDERLGRHARARPGRAPAYVRGVAPLRQPRRVGARASPPGARHDGVPEGEAPGGAHRREPESGRARRRPPSTRCARARARRSRRRSPGTS